MLVSGTRYTNDLYISTAFDPDNGECTVSVEIITNEGEKTIINGEVTWSEGE